MIMIKKTIIYAILNLCLVCCSFMNTPKENANSTINFSLDETDNQNESSHIQHKLRSTKEETITNSSQKIFTKESSDQIITENREPGGTITSIKVDTNNKFIPPYYIYPSQNDNQDIQSDSTVIPASWKISW